MCKFRLFFSFVFSALVLTPVYAAAEDYSNAIKVFKDSPVVEPFFNKSYGYAVFPTIGKGGIGIGGAHGSGQVYQGGELTGKTTMTQLTIGWQLGGQAYSQIIFFEDKRAYNDFTSGNFEFGAQASAVAITAGAQAETEFHKGMAVFTRAKGGLMYEAAIAGQKFSFDAVEK